ncbi:MAG: BACON domain-containing protein [Prevotella sp.]|nr:BACON domain-containing protein [Prevotella sp.]
MKTKIFITILASLPLVAGLTGCKSDDETQAKPAKEILKVEGGNIEIRANEETKDVAITADCAWTVTYDGGDFGSKLSVQPLKGNGNGTLVITTDQNTTLSDRIATITLTSDGGLQQKISVRQTSSDPGMTVTKSLYEFDAIPSASQLLTITSNTNWNIVMPSGVDWIHLSSTSGSTGSTPVDITVDEIQTDADRSAIFTIQYGSGSTEIEVKQVGKTNIELSVTPVELPVFTPEGGTQTVKVTSNAAWRAFIPTSQQDWLHIEPASGVGNGEIKVTCDAYSETERDRITVLIVVAGSQNPQQADVIIQQSAAEVVEIPGENDNPDPILSRKQ